MNRRRILSSIHRDIARKQGVNAVAWFSGQSFHQSAADMPFERIPDRELNKAGAALLPKPEPEAEPEPLKRCVYCGGPNLAADDFYCSKICAINAQGEEDR